MAGSTPPSQAEELLAGVNKYCEQIPVLQKMATQFGVKPALLLMVGISVLLPFALFGIGGDTLCYIAGGVCPGYFSFKALKSKDMEKMSLLLKYWVIFITVSLVELFADFLLFWIPMYNLDFYECSLQVDDDIRVLCSLAACFYRCFGRTDDLDLHLVSFKIFSFNSSFFPPLVTHTGTTS
ncbi:unnamed protein product [Amoebophrya sp. A120]|nr:unnamed protein product [Amoebophrya sp. A120]|eukprot:GSA120T00003029001.1